MVKENWFLLKIDILSFSTRGGAVAKIQPFF